MAPAVRAGFLARTALRTSNSPEEVLAGGWVGTQILQRIPPFRLSGSSMAVRIGFGICRSTRTGAQGSHTLQIGIDVRRNRSPLTSPDS